MSFRDSRGNVPVDYIHLGLRIFELERKLKSPGAILRVLFGYLDDMSNLYVYAILLRRRFQIQIQHCS